MRFIVSAVQTGSRVLAIFAALLILIMMALTVGDIVHRLTVGRSIAGVFEWSEVALTASVFLALPYTMQIGGHVAVDSLYTRLPPNFARFIASIALVAVIPFIVWFMISSWDVTLQAWIGGEARMGIVRVPLWPARLSITLGLLLLAAETTIASVKEFPTYNSRQELN